ncbi:hypothetical protein Tco_0278011 [Tanacetum coccineum]
MQLEERKLHQKCLAWLKELKSHLGILHKFSEARNTRPFEFAFRIFFHEEHQNFKEKMYHNLNQLQWQLERQNLHSCDPKTCLDVLRTQFKEFFDSKEEIQQQKSLVTKGTTLEANLSTDGIASDASSVTEGTTLEACLVTEGITLDDNLVAKESIDNSLTSSEQLDESSNSGNDADGEKIQVDMVASDIEYAEIGPSYDSDTVTEVHYSNNDTFENVLNENNEQPKSIPDTYVVNENNSDIISNIPNMDQVRDKEEHDDVDDEQQRTFFASLINNLKCDVEKCIKINREVQEANALLTNEPKRYKEKENSLQKKQQLNLNTAKRLSF